MLCLDHHRGSEEHQPGEEYHDPELFDAGAARMDSLHALRRTLRLAELEQHAVLLVCSSQQAARFWTTKLALLFTGQGIQQLLAGDCVVGFVPKFSLPGIRR